QVRAHAIPGPRTHLDGVHQQARGHHAQARQQDGHGDLARRGEGGLEGHPVGGPRELTAEASQLLALEAELQVQLRDHHGQALATCPGASVASSCSTARHSSPQVQAQRPPGGSAARASEGSRQVLGQGQSPGARNKGHCDSQPRSGDRRH
ncbi:hypothetical protein H1C71_042252, partial [Ictidomys tridecemlineatus]